MNDSKKNHRKHTLNIRDYLENITVNQYQLKIDQKLVKPPKTHDINLLKIEYKSSIKKIPFMYYDMLNEYCRYIDYKLQEIGLKNINKIKWKFVMSINQLEDGMPFTISDYIVLNNYMLRKQYLLFLKYGATNKSFKETLFHEKVHVLQRLFTNQFNTFYKMFYKHLEKEYKYDINFFPKEIQDRIMLNPDNNLTIWKYKINGKKYIPIFIKLNHEYKTICYDNIEKKFVYTEHRDHPNETFAYAVERFVINNIYPQKQHYFDFLKTIAT